MEVREGGKGRGMGLWSGVKGRGNWRDCSISGTISVKGEEEEEIEKTNDLEWIEKDEEE